MAKIVREQMQVTEAERYLQKSKRKEYSDAAVNLNINMNFNIHQNSFIFI